MNSTILIVDDDSGFRQLLEAILRGEGYAVATAAKVGEARKACGAGRYSLVISDLKMPDGDGLDVQKWFMEQAPGTPFVLITGFGTVATAVEAMKALGVHDGLQGKFVTAENITQAASRDVMAEAMLRLKAAGFNLVMTVHDEIVAEADGKSLKDFHEIMVQAPKWCADLPIEVETFESFRYRK